MLSRRSLIAAAIAALHILVVYAFAAMTVRRVQQTPQAEKPIAMLNMAKPEPAKSIPAPHVPGMAQHVVDVPKAPTIAVTLPKADDLAALRSYVWCGALDDGKALGASAKPCQNMKLDLHKTSNGPRQPTEDEQAQMRHFDRQYAMAKAPVLLPCFGGGGVSLMCVVEGIANGFEFTPGSYAGGDRGKCDPRFAGAAPCAQNYSLQSFAPTNSPPAR